MSLLGNRIDDQAVKVRQTTTPSTRAATLDRGRIEPEANGAGIVDHLLTVFTYVLAKERVVY